MAAGGWRLAAGGYRLGLPLQAVFRVFLADFPAPQLSTYPLFTVISEKLHPIQAQGNRT